MKKSENKEKDCLMDIENSLKVIDKFQLSIPPTPAEAWRYKLQYKVCGNCAHFVDIQRGQQKILKEKFWDYVFHRHGNRKDLKPYQIGDLSQYSICEIDGSKCSMFHDACPKYKPKKQFARIFTDKK